MKSVALALAVLLAPVLMTAQSSPTPSAPPRYHVNVRLVNVFVSVTDATGAPVGGLNREDFSIFEDKIPQKISYFERETSMPLSLALAIDTSGSVRKDLDIERHAAHDFIHALIRPVDRMDLIDFNSDVREVVPFTSDVRRLDSGLANLSTGPATALYNAIYLSAQNLAPRSGRRVLVVISDGGNTVDGIDYAHALEAAVRGEIMVYSIIDLPIIADAGRDTGGEHALITLSQETGGKYFYAEGGELAQAFQQVSDDLRTQYLIGYYPVQRRSENDFRRIQVTLRSNRGYALRYRTGYYAEPSEPLDQ